MQMLYTELVDLGFGRTNRHPRPQRRSCCPVRCRWRVVAGVAATLGTGLLVGTAWNIIKKREQQ